MSFPWSSIEQVDRQVNLLLRDVRKAHLFGKELSEQTIQVLVGATLPGMVRMCKVDTHVCMSFQRFVICHLRAIVEGKATFEMGRKWRQQALCLPTEGFFGRFGNVSHESVAAPSFYERHEIAAVAASSHSVTLPVPIEQALVRGLWSGINPALLGEFASSLATFRTVPAPQLGMT